MKLIFTTYCLRFSQENVNYMLLKQKTDHRGNMGKTRLRRQQRYREKKVKQFQLWSEPKFKTEKNLMWNKQD